MSKLPHSNVSPRAPKYWELQAFHDANLMEVLNSGRAKNIKKN